MKLRHALMATGAVAGRVLRQAFTTPALLLPPLLGPLVFFAIFGGGLSAVASLPRFSHEGGYAAFQLVFALVQGVVFAGVFTGGLTLARDLESGFARRLMIAVPQRGLVLAGYVLAAVVRAASTAAVLVMAALLVGLDLRISLLGVVVLAVMLAAAAAAAALWGVGVALRRQTVQAAPLMTMPMFMALFLAPVFVPLALLDGWIRDVARFNPVTVLLEEGRELIAGGATSGAVSALLVGFAAAAVLGVWARRGLRRVTSG
jgi:ABC-2 type transport system permease protein